MTNPIFPGRSFFHGTKAKLKTGDLIAGGYNSNYGTRAMAGYVYMSGTLNAAIWGAELAVGDEPGRIYVVEATGPIEDDPNLTDQKYPGNPTLSYRSKEPLRVLGEVETGLPFSVADAWMRPLPIITKAGAFGSPESLVRCHDFLRKHHVVASPPLKDPLLHYES